MSRSAPDLSVRVGALDLAGCADEPIRVPGAIQPHGRLLVVSVHDRRVAAYSSNWAGRDGAEAGLRATNFDIDQLQAGDGPTALGIVQVHDGAFHASVHRMGPFAIVEFEAVTYDYGTQAPIYTLARTFLPRMQRAEMVLQLAELAVEEIQRLTGFGRVLLYRFDTEGNGQVLAEAADEGYERYLGHRFPAEDIPAQARELYRLNRIRLIPDANYTPVDLVCVQPGLEPRSIDLSYAALRSVSPIHLEYMRNMGTLASMSVSIVVAGKLWGLISCHDHAPRALGFATRAACEHLGSLLSMQIEAKEDNAAVATRLELRKLTLEIVSHLADSDSTLQRVLAEPVPLLRLADASGVAVVLNDQCWTSGETPGSEDIEIISNWVAAQKDVVAYTDWLAEACPSAAGPGQPAGVMALSISQVHRHQLIWFRPELVQTIRWAGEPSKQPRSSDGRIHPRRSFASWVQQLRGRSSPWLPEQVTAVTELRQALIGIVLRRAEEMAEVATELGRVNKELEAFSYTVSHDLRAPMRHIAGYVDLVLDAEGKNMGERAKRYLSHVKEAAAYSGHLVDALLDFSRMGRAALKRHWVDTEALVDELVAEYGRQEAGRAIRWQVDKPLPRVWADPFLLQVALRNLLGNACKYTRGKPEPAIVIRAVSRPEGTGLEVEDNGVGFQMKYVHKLFGVFQRLHQAEEYEGAGIGLASVRRIIERHGGQVWAHGEPGVGARFGFLLPPPAGTRTG
jgi:light-regulated signal transduction histidine kinase (bacteriophytochrome)